MIETILSTTPNLIDGTREYVVSWDMFSTFILGVCGLVAAIWGVVEIVAKVKKQFKKPENMQNAKIKYLENGQDALKRELDNLKTSTDSKYEMALKRYDTLIRHYYETKTQHDMAISETSEGLLILIKAVSNLTYHTRYGNHEQEMTDSLHEMEEYTQRKAKYSPNTEATDAYEEIKKQLENID